MSSTPSRPLRVVVAGGYGFFGSSICHALAGAPGVRLIVAGRDACAAQQAAHPLGLESAGLDVAAGGVAHALEQLKADLVVDATGVYGGDYPLARAALAAGASCIDIADSRSHVCGIGRLDTLARARSRLIVSGASSVPALSAAVIDAHLHDFEQLQRISYGITASERTPGVAAITSVLAYCGRPIPGHANGGAVVRIGWQGGRLVRFNAPLGWRWLARCDIPDLDLFPTRYPTLHAMEFRAGVAMLPSMLGIWLLSWLVRLGVMTSAAPLAPRLRRWARWLEPFGSGRSGLYVDMQGMDRHGRNLRRRWQLIATHNHGPRVPAMGAVALVRRIARSGLPAIGARPAAGLISLEDYLHELSGLHIEVFSEDLPP